MTGVGPALTDRQTELLDELTKKRKAGTITAKQTKTLGELEEKRDAPPTLSKTTISYLNKLHREEVFGRRYEIKSKYLEKGIHQEEDSITLYTEVFGELLLKNKETFSNDYITGTPDNIQGKVRDFKSSWDFTTFPMYETSLPNSDYYWQMQGYMDLTGLKTAEVAYCLVDTSEVLIQDEIRRTGWKLGMIDIPEDLEKEIEANMRYEDIPKEMRVKVFQVDYDPDKIVSLYKQIELCRKYLNELSLTVADTIL